MGKANQRKRREKKKSRLDSAFVSSNRPSLSIRDYLNCDDASPGLMQKYQVLIPRDLANAVYLLIDGDMSVPAEDINRLFGHLPYHLRLTMSYGPARFYIASVLGDQDPEPRDFYKLALLIWAASSFSPMARRFDD